MHEVEDDLIEQTLTLLPQLSKSIFRAILEYVAVSEEALHERAQDDQSRLETSKSPHSMAQLKAMMFIYGHGPCPVGEIAEWLGVTAPTISGQIGEMAERGLVNRTINPDDRRQILVELTPRAAEIAAYIQRLRRAQVTEVLKQFEPAERPVIVRGLSAIVEVLGRQHDEVLVEVERELAPG